MELAIRSSYAYDPKVQTLAIQIRQLDAKFSELQQEHARIQNEHSRRCSDALTASVSHLAKVIDDVGKADKKLIYWYEQKSGVKLMLRCVGIDKRTGAIVGRKTKKIKGDIKKTEKKFRHTSEVFTEGLTAVQGLNTRVTSYSLLEVGEAHNASTSTLRDFSDELDEVETTTREKRLEHIQVEELVEEVRIDIDRTENSRSIAADGSERHEGHAIGGLLLTASAAVGGFFFPPLWAAVPVTATYGAVNGIASSTLDTQARNLQVRSDQLQGQLSGLQDQIRELEAQMPALENKKRTLSNSVDAVSALQNNCSSLQQDSRGLLDQLTSAQMVLSRIRMQLDRVATGLMKCEYKKTRKGIADQLRNVVNEIRDGEIAQHYQVRKLSAIEGKLDLLETRTSAVLMVLG